MSLFLESWKPLRGEKGGRKRIFKTYLLLQVSEAEYSELLDEEVPFTFFLLALLPGRFCLAGGYLKRALQIACVKPTKQECSSGISQTLSERDGTEKHKWAFYYSKHLLCSEGLLWQEKEAKINLDFPCHITACRAQHLEAFCAICKLPSAAGISPTTITNLSRQDEPLCLGTRTEFVVEDC